MISVKDNTPLLTMPVELRRFVLNKCTHSSPYNRTESGSYYNTADKSWDYTPDGSIRVSDHWNFPSRGNIHCKTDVPDSKLIGKWAIFGCITWESKTGSSFCIKNQFGYVREIRKYNSYKEFKRKPKN